MNIIQAATFHIILVHYAWYRKTINGVQTYRKGNIEAVYQALFNYI